MEAEKAEAKKKERKIYTAEEFDEMRLLFGMPEDEIEAIREE